MTKTHKHGRYPGQPEWINKEFPMYEDYMGKTVWDIGILSDDGSVYHTFQANMGLCAFGSQEHALKHLTPIYEHPLNWSDRIACWDTKAEFVFIDLVYLEIDHKFDHVVLIPDHMLKMDNPPTDVETWQRMYDNGELEVIK